ncbi:MAG: hypothetical protein ABR537_10855 [Gemmatimonadales bacterium]
MALATAPYIMDSCWTYVWRGVLEYQQGNPSLARLNFRRALRLYADPDFPLDSVSPSLAKLYDSEFRAVRVFAARDADQPARWKIGPALAYPTALRARSMPPSGHALVRWIVDTAGRVAEGDIEVLQTPDSAFVAPLKQMLVKAVFTPALIGGRPVRTMVASLFTLTP